MSLKPPADLRDEIRAMLSKVPTSCSRVKLYPAGLNYCECYYMAEAIRARFEPYTPFEVMKRRDRQSVTASEIDVDYVYRLFLNDEGGGAELRDLGSSMYLALEPEDTFAILACDYDFMRRAVPFPDEIWATYFEQMMKANEPCAYKIVLDEFEAWLSNRVK